MTTLDIRLQEVAGFLEMEMVLVPNEGEYEKKQKNKWIKLYALGRFEDSCCNEDIIK